MRRILIALAACVLALPGAARAERLLASERTHVRVGEPVELTVVDTTGAPLPPVLEARLTRGNDRVRVSLRARGEGAPAHRRYVLDWPAELVGLGVLSLEGEDGSRLMLLAERPGWGAGEDPVARAQGVRVASAAATTAAPALSFYDPMYFLVGANGGASARFQLSFKYRLFDDEGMAVGMLPFLRGLHFGYTQTSLWDLASESAPFRDTSYRPALFYEWTLPTDADGRHKSWLRAGVEHESNGRDGALSRSMNIAFAQADWQYRLDAAGTHIGVTPKVWAYLEKRDNDDIQRYRGFGELGLRYGREDGWLAKLNIRRGKGGVGTSQVDVSYPLRRSLFSSVGAFLHFQYFDGEGETLLDYRRAGHPQLRIGVSIVR